MTDLQHFAMTVNSYSSFSDSGSNWNLAWKIEPEPDACQFSVSISCHLRILCTDCADFLMSMPACFGQSLLAAKQETDLLSTTPRSLDEPSLPSGCPTEILPKHEYYTGKTDISDLGFSCRHALQKLQCNSSHSDKLHSLLQALALRLWPQAGWVLVTKFARET